MSDPIELHTTATQSAQGGLKVSRLTHRYGMALAVDDVNFSVPQGEIVALLGPSGCGKSTVLRLLAGLIVPDSGRVTFGGEALQPDNVQALRLRMGYVIQEGGLFPHLSAGANVALAARFLKRPDAEVRKRLDELCELVALPPSLLSRYPRELSGGQRQRVALMRALMLDPALLLLDEPLGALDPVTRRALQHDLKDIFAQLGKTVIMITHDMGEAAHFAGDLIVMRDGRLLQRGTLDDLLKRPADAYVSEFISAQCAPLERLGSAA